MPSKPLTTAVLGLDGRGRQLAEAASRCDQFEIVGVADRDPDQAKVVSERFGCAAFDDYRQLIVRSSVDCLLVAEDIHRCDEFVRAAMKRGASVLKLAPPARDLEETAEFVRLAESCGVQYVVANPDRQRPSFATLRQKVRQGEIDRPFLVRVLWGQAPGGRPAWLTDPKLAGGGVLLRDCWSAIDWIGTCFPTPDQVYCLTTNQAPDKQQRLYLTEDTVVLTLRFSDTLVACIVASRQAEAAPVEKTFEVWGANTLITAGLDHVVVRTEPAAPGERTDWAENELDCMIRQMELFATGVREPGEDLDLCRGAKCLETMAVIEAAYVSARTGIPEEPARILHMAPGQARPGLDTTGGAAPDAV